MQTTRTPLEILQTNPSFGELPEDALKHFAGFSYKRVLQHGERLGTKGTDPVGIAIVASGSICATSYGQRGQTFAFSMTEIGGVWGLMAVLEPSKLMRESRAQGTTELLILPRLPLLATLEERPVLWRYFAKMLCRHLSSAHQVIDVIALRSLRERLARQLYLAAYPLAQTAQPSVPVRIQQTQDELAALLVVSRHAVNRELKRFESNGLVKTGYGFVAVTDMAGLLKICGPQSLLGVPQSSLGSPRLDC